MRRGIAVAATLAGFVAVGVVHSHEPHEHGNHGPGGNGWDVPTEAVEQPNPVEATHQSIEVGRELYTQLCLRCHGSKGRGDGREAQSLHTAPADLIAHGPHHTDGDLAWRVREGRSDMPSFKDILSETEVWHAVNYIRALEEKAAAAGITPPDPH